jgi:hypothetical protein
MVTNTGSLDELDVFAGPITLRRRQSSDPVGVPALGLVQYGYPCTQLGPGAVAFKVMFEELIDELIG